MATRKHKITVLGAGPSGLALAMKLLRRKDLNAHVTVVDLKPYVGGLAASFEKSGLYFDHGSHRLHPATSDEIMGDIRGLLGDKLFEAPSKWTHQFTWEVCQIPIEPNKPGNAPAAFIYGWLCLGYAFEALAQEAQAPTLVR